MSKKRIISNFKSGTLGADLTTGSTTIDFGSSPGFATLAADEYIPLIIDPDGSGNGPEIVYLTAYTSGGTTGTIDRGEEGTSDPGSTHASGAVWRHGPTAIDVRNMWAQTTLTNHTGTATTTTYEQWGTEEVTFSQANSPRYAIVSARVNGWARNAGGANRGAGVRISISLDGGSSFTAGTACFMTIPTGIDFPVYAHQLRSGEVTGEVQVKVEVRNFTATGDPDWFDGRVIAEVKPFRPGDA